VKGVQRSDRLQGPGHEGGGRSGGFGPVAA
jgi:hypothetical protein